MRKCLHWLVVISIVLIPHSLLFLPSVLGATDNTNVKKVIIKAGKESCVFRGASNDIVRLPVLVGDCSLLSYEKPESMVWLQFPDGKIRAPNGLCLTVREGAPQVTKCSSKQSDGEESWVVDSNGVMKNKNNNCFKLAKGDDELQVAKCSDNHKPAQNTQEVPLFFSFEPNNDLTHQLLAAEYAEAKISLLNSHRFSEIKSHYSDVSWKLADLLTEVRQLKKFENEIDTKHQEAERYLEAAKLHQEELATIEHFGSGVFVEVYDTLQTKETMPSMSFTLDVVDINPQLLESYGVANQGPLAIKIKAFVSAPKDGHYTFVARDLNSVMSISVGGSKILSQWFPPIMNHVSSLPVYLRKRRPVPILIEAHAVFGVPSFKLNWYSGDFDERPVPNSFLFPDVLDESCAPKTRRLASCNTTFREFKADGTFQVSCPSGCAAEATAFGSAVCYSLDSSICFAATAAGFLPERGGVVTVTVALNEKRSHYPGVEGFNRIRTEDSPEGTGCGKIKSYDAEVGAAFAVTDVKLVDPKSLISASSNPKSFAGYEGVVSNADSVLLTKRGGDGKYITDIIMSCGTSQTYTGYEPVGGDIFIKRSQSANDPAVSDAYITVNEQSQPSIFPSHDGWSRKTCGDTSLYIRHATQSSPMDYSSHSLSCEDTFDIPSVANSALTSFVIRCPQHCEKKNAPVFGLFLYDHQSSVCRAAIHAGVISGDGGLVQVTRIDGLPARNGSERVARNGVTVYLAQSTAPSYYLSSPRGSPCSYPSVPGLVHEKEFIRRAPVSFLEMEQKVSPAPPAVELPKQEAALPNQLGHIMTALNFPQSLVPPATIIAPTLLSYQQYPVAVPYLPQYQTALAPNFSILTSKQADASKVPTSIPAASASNPHGIPPSQKKAEDLSEQKKKAKQPETLRFQEVLLRQREQLAALEHQTLEMGSKFDFTNSQVSGLHAEIAKIRNHQKERDARRAEMLFSLEAIRGAFREKLKEKEGQIQRLEKILSQASPVHSATFSELFKSQDINSRYVIVDGEKSSFGPSNWSLKKVDGHYAITQDSGISSPKCFGTMAIARDQNLSKGFVFAKVLIPPGGGSVALIFKYFNNRNFKAFEISGTGIARFREMKDGVFSPPLGEIKTLPLASQWVNVGVDFGLKNVRGFVEGKPITGMQVSQNPGSPDGGSIGVATNGASGLAAFAKLIAGPLDKEAQAGPAAFGATTPSISATTSSMVAATIVPHETQESFGVPTMVAPPSVPPQHKVNCTLPFKEELQTRLSVNWMVQPMSGWSLGGDQEGKFISGSNGGRHGSTFTANAILLKRSAICPPHGSTRITVYVRLEPLSRAGIVWRATSSRSFYAAVLDNATKNAPKVSVLKVDNKTPYEFSTAQTEIAPKAFYKLEVFNNPTKVRVLLDGKPLMEETLPKYEKEGRLGLIVLDGNANFKDFELNTA